MPFLTRENRYCFGAILNVIAPNFTQQEKELLIQEIVQTTEKMMESIMTRRSPRKWAKSWCGKYKHSERRIVRDTIFVNLLSRNQLLPARPREFRANLSEEEKKIETVRWYFISC
ncbi:MAG: hypothetical protein M3O24_02090 [Thermoproteota archaeon]|nr:hypothetical protein [Thermoproteota archaeon]